MKEAAGVEPSIAARFGKKVDVARATSTQSETRTMKEAAARMGVSRGSALRARGIRKHGTDADVAATMAPML
jgi:hypothetical protein